MRHILWAFLCAAVLLWGPPALAADEGEKATDEKTGPTVAEQMDDAQARGYSEAAEGDPDEAVDWFQKAADCADRLASWEGLMDAGLGLSSVGDSSAAKAVIDKANELSAKFKDWRTSLAVGQAYANLPEEAQAEDKAEAAIDEAKALAEKLKSWRAMVEVGTAYAGLKIEDAKNYATDAYNDALKIVEEAQDPEGYEVLAARFDEVGETTKAAEAREMVKQLPPKKNKKRDRPPTPPGWSATGSSLAEPRELSEESKAILAERAARKHAEATARALKEGDVDNQTLYIYEYSRYWRTHPDQFRQRIWGQDQDFDVSTWGQEHLNDFHLVHGLWVRGAAE